jgi:transposase
MMIELIDSLVNILGPIATSSRENEAKKESTPLRDFFQRISFRKGRVSAISATARKLGVIIWNMVTHGTNYINPAGYLFLDQKRKLGIVKRIQKQIDKFGLTNEDVVFATV